MKTVQGDLIKLALEGQFDVIVHGCNCFCSMGAGIARTIRLTFPEAYEADLKTTSGDKHKPGTISWAKHDAITIVNAYTQYHYSGKPPLVDYDAVRSCFKIIKREFSGLRIGYPAIGAGLAGGDWKIISKIIDEELEGEDHTFVEFSR